MEVTQFGLVMISAANMKAQILEISLSCRERSNYIVESQPLLCVSAPTHLRSQNNDFIITILL